MRSRVRFLPAVFLLFLAACVGTQVGNDASHPTLVPAGLNEKDIQGLQALMDEGSLTSEQLTRFYLDRITGLDDSGPRLNALLEVNTEALQIAASLDEERRTRGPRGPLHGIPVVLKANIDTGDRLSTTAGSLALAGHIADHDAFLVARLREAGAVILGKANLSEWANFRSTRSSSGWSSEGRQAKNPYAIDRNPCGSSSGSAVAVSANLTSVAVGTETDGSVVCPAGANGVVGIKPTLGLVSRNGIIPIAHSQDTAGPMGRTVMDAAILLTGMVAKDGDDAASSDFPDPAPDYLVGIEEGIAGMKIGVQRDNFGAGNDPDVEAVLKQALETFKQLGAEILDPIELGDRAGMNDAEYEVLLYEFKTDLASYLVSHGSPNGMSSLDDLIRFNEEHVEETMPFFGQEIFEAATGKGPLTDEAYLEALKKSKGLARGVIDGALEKYDLDAIIAPTNGPAWKSDLINGDNFVMASSSLAAIAGYPNITVPMGSVHGLPVGLSIFGPAYGEPGLLKIAWAFEQATKARRQPEMLQTLALD